MLRSCLGSAAYFRDEDYGAAELDAEARSVLRKADVILQVQPLSIEDIAELKSGAVLVGLQQPWSSKERIELLRQKNITCFALELLPRISRAQEHGCAVSQAAVAGYECALIAAVGQVLSDADLRRGHDPSGEGAGDRCRRGPACRRSPRPSGSARWFPATTCAPKPRSRSNRWAPS